MEENGKKEDNESNHMPIMMGQILPTGLRRQKGPIGGLGSRDWKVFYGAGWRGGYVNRRINYSS